MSDPVRLLARARRDGGSEVEFEARLLASARRDRPPPGGKARMLAAVGVGAGVGVGASAATASAALNATATATATATAGAAGALGSVPPAAAAGGTKAIVGAALAKWIGAALVVSAASAGATYVAHERAVARETAAAVAAPISAPVPPPRALGGPRLAENAPRPAELEPPATASPAERVTRDEHAVALAHPRAAAPANASPPPASPAAVAPPASPATPASAAAPPASAAVASPAPSDRLAEEVTMVDDARHALRAGDDDGALAAASRYRAAFGDGGELAAEMLAIAIEAHERRGDHAIAVVLGRRWLARFPRAEAAARVRAIVERDR